MTANCSFKAVMQPLAPALRRHWPVSTQIIAFERIDVIMPTVIEVDMLVLMEQSNWPSVAKDGTPDIHHGAQ